MDWQAGWTLAVVLGVVVVLIRDRMAPEVVLWSGLLLLVASGVISTSEALLGLASQSVVTIAGLYVVGMGLQSTGALDVLGQLLLGRPRRAPRPVLRLVAPSAVLSTVFNNTPLVSLFMPMLVQRARQASQSPSLYLLPLSFAAMLGGTCTLIGTSTNLVVNDVLRRQDPTLGLGFFELAWVGVPVLLLGLAYLHFFRRRLLPDREDLLERVEHNPREYSIQMMVNADCPLIGKTIRKAGLRDLPGLYLFRIERMQQTIQPVKPQDVLRAGDVLSFSGILSTVVDLQRIRGLLPVAHQGKEAGPTPDLADSLDSMEGLPASPTPVAPPPTRSGRHLYEVVVSRSSPLVGRKVRDCRFRSHYGSSILAVHRSGHKLEQKIGQITLFAGDSLLIDADDDFVQQWRNSPDFVLVSDIEDSEPVAHERHGIALTIFLLVVVGMIALPSDPALPALAGAVFMALTGCVAAAQVARVIEWPILLVIAGALGLGRAMNDSGAAQMLAGSLVHLESLGPWMLLAGVFIMTNLLSQFLSNNATAALMASIALATAHQAGLNPRPFLIAVAVAASASFATPLGYQTNLMVRNPGGYEFVDYLRLGIPLTLLVGLLAVGIIPLIWPF